MSNARRVMVVMFVCMSAMALFGQILGPVYPAPGGNTFASSGDALKGNAGRTASYGGFNNQSYGELWWTLTSIANPYDSTHDPMGTGNMTFVSIMGGVAEWDSTANLVFFDPKLNQNISVPTRFLMAVSGATYDTTPHTPAWSVPGSFSANQKYEGLYNGGWIALGDLYNQFNHNCSGGGQCLQTGSNGGFYYTSPTFYSLNVSLNPNVGGTVTSADGHIMCPGNCGNSYANNTPVTLNATAVQGWTFRGWSGACTGTGPCKVTMTQDLAVTATFTNNAGALQFIPIVPCRLVDTRQSKGEFGGPALQARSQRSFIVPDNKDCNIPASAAVYSLNVTVAPHGQLGYLTAWPTGQDQPFVSTLNSDGRVKAAAAIVPAGTKGAVSFYVTDTTDLILDIDGYFAPISNSTLAFYPLPPCRVVDTRGPAGDLGGPHLKAGVEREFSILQASACKIPDTAQAYSLNFTAVPRGPLGYLTVWPAGQDQPLASTLNAPTGAATANAAIVPAGRGGAVSTFAYNDTDLVIDIDGYFAPAQKGGLSLYSVAPCRVLDTRAPSGNGPFNGDLNLPVDVVGSPCKVSAKSQAYVFNATVVPPGSLGYLTLWPDGGKQPGVSTLNAYDGAITSNMAIVPAGTKGKVDAYAFGSTDLILDISSFFAP